MERYEDDFEYDDDFTDYEVDDGYSNKFDDYYWQYIYQEYGEPADWIDEMLCAAGGEEPDSVELGDEPRFDLAEKQRERQRRKRLRAILLSQEKESLTRQKEKCDRERLKEYGLPPCGSHKAIARLMGISVKKLRFLAFSRKTSHYIRFQIPKKIGGKRDISAPILQLKQAQEWILENILEKLEPHNAAHGFRCGRSIVTNAQPHVGAEAIINVDLQDFFPSISYKRVKGLFKSFGYSEAASIVFSLICTEPKLKEVELDGTKHLLLSWTERRLPQGAPTSPAISNLLCRRLDRRLSQMADRLGFIYTRYADDLTFSTSNESLGNIGKILKFTKLIVNYEGFEINDKKTRVIHKSRQQEVTGVVVNSKLNISREILRRFRATLYQIEKDGLKGKHWGQCHDIIASLQGFANFIHMINPEKGAKFQEQVRGIKEEYGRGQARVDSVNEPITLPDVIALTNAEIKRLSWSKKKRREHL